MPKRNCKYSLKAGRQSRPKAKGRVCACALILTLLITDKESNCRREHISVSASGKSACRRVKELDECQKGTANTYSPIENSRPKSKVHF